MKPGDHVVVADRNKTRPWISEHAPVQDVLTLAELAALTRTYDQIPANGTKGRLLRLLSWPGKNATEVWLVVIAWGVICVNAEGLTLDGDPAVVRAELVDQLEAHARASDQPLAASGVPSPRDRPSITDEHRVAWSAEVTRRLTERQRLYGLSICVQPDDIDL